MNQCQQSLFELSGRKHFLGSPTQCVSSVLLGGLQHTHRAHLLVGPRFGQCHRFRRTRWHSQPGLRSVHQRLSAIMMLENRDFATDDMSVTRTNRGSRGLELDDGSCCREGCEEEEDEAPGVAGPVGRECGRRVTGKCRCTSRDMALP